MTIANHTREKFHGNGAYANHVGNHGHFDRLSVLVHLFEGGVFQVVEPAYGGTDR